MLPITRPQLAVLAGILKNPNPYIAQYVKNGQLVETEIDGKKFIDIDNKQNYSFITSRVSGSQKHMDLIKKIADDRKCPSVKELKRILGDEKKKEVVAPKVESTTKEPIQSNQIGIDDMVLSSLKDYKDFYDAKQKQERWEMLKIEKAKMLGESIPTSIATESLSVFASSMQKVFVEMTKQWITDISHEASLDAVITGKMRSRMVDIVNESFRKAISVSKKQLKDGIDDSKAHKIEIKEDERSDN